MIPLGAVRSHPRAPLTSANFLRRQVLALKAFPSQLLWGISLLSRQRVFIPIPSTVITTDWQLGHPLGFLCHAGSPPNDCDAHVQAIRVTFLTSEMLLASLVHFIRLYLYWTLVHDCTILYTLPKCTSLTHYTFVQNACSCGCHESINSIHSITEYTYSSEWKPIVCTKQIHLLSFYRHRRVVLEK